MLKLLLFLTVNLLLSMARAEDTFNQGLEAFQKGDYDSAQKTFSSYINNPHHRYNALYNLGVLAAKRQQPGEALGYFRQAQQLSPRDKDLLFNMKQVVNKFNITPPTGNISSFEVFRQEVLNLFTFYEFSVFCFLLLGLSSFFLTTYLKIMTTSEEKSPPPIALLLASFFFLLSLVLTIFKLTDSYSARATIVTAKTELKSGPSSNNATLAEINEGAEVLVKDTHQDHSGTWKQISIPGNLTGWVSEKNLMSTTGGGPW